MNARFLFLKYSQFIALAGCTVSCGVMIVNRKYIDKLFIYNTIKKEGDKALFCDENLQNLLMKVGNKMNIPESKLQKIVLYYNSMNCPIYNGYLCDNSQSSNGLSLQSVPSIGLPNYYKNIYFDETKFDNLVIDGRQVPLEPDQPQGVEFRRQLLLTEDAKKFVLGQQLYYLDSKTSIVTPAVQICSCYVLYQVVYMITSKLPVSKGLLRGCLCGLAGLIVLLIQKELLEMYRTKLAFRADRIVSSLGPRYHTGAVEFYTKMIGVNKILHGLGFSDKFNKVGNEVTGVVLGSSLVTSHSRLARLFQDNKD